MVRWVCLAALVLGCGHRQPAGEAIDAAAAPDACEGLACFQVDCAAQGLPPTSVSGQVFAPNGTLQLFGVNVYVPAVDPGDLHDGVQCDNCSAGLAGNPIAQTSTDEDGRFRLDNVPATTNVMVVVQVGKWRRKVMLPVVAPCQDTPLAAADVALPKNRGEGDMPQIAITTGGADALECLVQKLGVDDHEITTSNGTGRVHLYADLNAVLPGAPIDEGRGALQFDPTFVGEPGATFTDAADLWNSLDNLKKYDIVLFSCEGDQFANTKPMTAMQNVHDYADLGGRVFMSHWHNIWIAGDKVDTTHVLPDWKVVAKFDFAAPADLDDTIALVDESIPRGVSFATWLVNVGASTVRDQVPISGARYTCMANNPSRSERKIYIDPATSMNHVSVQDLQFTTPQDANPDQRCGKVVFSDMHVASGSTSDPMTPFPNGCSPMPLTPQEKALAFIFFDIASCVGPVF